ncbi:MAG TPA: hypothetical protein PLH94_12255 [Fimbriimonadaceae bacterium]|nr:hypothetical protein [Fimbriimonadaceae bacterium]
MKRLTLFLVAGASFMLAAPAHAQFEIAFRAVQRVTDEIAPFDLNSVSGIQRELRKRAARGKTPGFLEAYLEFFKARAYPNESFDWNQYNLAARQRDALPTAQFVKRKAPGTLGTPSGDWAFVGPTNTNPAYQTFFGDRAIMGRVTSLAFPPNPNRTAARSRVLYASTPGGGVWRTNDAGATWSNLTDLNAFWQSLQVGAVAVTNQTPSNPSTNTDIIIAGTGDPRGIYRMYSFGVMRSTDGGATWEAPKRLTADPQLPITSIVVDPDQPNRITLTTGGAATATGDGDNRYPPPSRQDYAGQIFQSTDWGQSWTAVERTGAYWSRVSIGAKERTGTRLYWACGWDGAGTAYVKFSTNRGQTWQNALSVPALAVGNANFASLDISASKNAPKTVYLMSGQDRAIYISENGSSTWSPITNNFPSQYFTAANDNWGQSSYDYYLEAVPMPGGYKDLLVVGQITLAAAIRDDGTGVWNWVDIGRTGTGGARIHNDQHCIAWDTRDPQNMFVGHDGGVHQLTFDRRAAFGLGAFAFTNRSANLRITQYYEGAWHPTAANTMIGGTQDNMSSRSAGGAATINNWEGTGGGDGSGSAISFSNPNIQVTLANIVGAFYTNDGWATLGGSSNLVSNPNRSFFPPTTFDVLGNFFWCDNQVNKYTTNGTNMNVVGGWANLAVPGGQYVTALAIPLADPDRIYVGTSGGWIYMARDGTDLPPTWERIDDGLGGDISPFRYVTDIAVNPFNPDQIVVSYSGIGTVGAPVTDHVYRCLDVLEPQATRVFTNVDTGAGKLPDVPINTVVWDNAPNPAIPDFHVTPRNPNAAIPDNNRTGITDTVNVNTTAIEIVTEVSVNLKIDGSWNGDLYAKLERGAETAVLLNGVGRNGSAPGYDDDGVDVFLTDASPSQGDIHTYQNVTGPLPVGVPLTGAWQSDGRNVGIGVVANATPRTNRLDVFNNKSPNGNWTLTVSDNGALDNHTLVSWTLTIRGLRADGTPVTRVYAGGDLGAFYTNDVAGGVVAWQNATQGLKLPNVQVNDMEHVPATGFLNAATFGRGMWRVPIGTAVMAGAMCRPSRFQGGGARTTRLRVVLAAPAPMGGATVTLTSGDPARLTAPANVVVPAGQVTATVNLVSNVAPVAEVTIPVSLRYNNELRQTFVRLTP